MMKRLDFADRLRDPRPLLLDGPLGTELNRRGVSTDLPLWSAWGLVRAPDVVSSIHAEYAAAGADVLTTNTFRTQRRSCARAGLEDRTTELTALAVRLARQAAAAVGHPCWVAGSMAPLEDCYSPDLTPRPAELASEHGEVAEQLAGLGVDLILVETMPTMREAEAATRAAAATGLPVLTGFTCDARGRLLSGRSVTRAAAAVEAAGASGLMINCTAADILEAPLRELRAATDLPTGAYGNVGHAEETIGWAATEVIDPGSYVEYARGWLEAGAMLVGSCCGTTPDHTRALARLLAGAGGMR
jgi:S-methylmethionine-dependent homocysteine/selenocysteine methylase